MKLFIEKRKWTFAIFFTLLMFFGTYLLGDADATPVSERTPQVRDAIVATVPGVEAAADVTEAHLAAITRLNMRAKNIAALKADDFDGLTALSDLNLYNNRLSGLPDGIFARLTALRTLRLGGNAVDPLPIPVTLEKVAEGQFKAVAPTGATFDYVVSITATNGSIIGDSTTVSIPQGHVESELLTVARAPGATGEVTVEIQTLPRLPSEHYGYALVRADTAPVSVIARINTAPVFTDGSSVTRAVAENTAAGTNIGATIRARDAENDTLTYTLSGVDASAFDIDSATGQLKTKAPVDYEAKRIYSVTITADDAELSDTISVIIHVIDINDTVIRIGFVPVMERTPEVRDAIVAVVPNARDAATVTEAEVAAIRHLNLRNRDISFLKTGDFSGMIALRNLNLYGNQLSDLPDGIFAGLTALTTLRLGGNVVDPLPIPVGLEKVAEGQFKAVAPTGATFDYVVSITATNGSIIGGATRVTIPQGHVESEILTVRRTPGATGEVTVEIQTLPRLPSTHYGYALVRADALPLSVIARINTAPVFIDGSSVTRAVAENTAAGTNIGAAIRARDAENDTLTYTLSGVDASAFAIDSVAGQLKTKAPLDYETQRIYTVTITADDAELSDTISVIIHVIDVNDTVIRIGFVPVMERTPEVRDAIVAVIPNARDAATVTEAEVAAIRHLNLRNRDISFLKTGDFSGMTALSNLNLYNNRLSGLPDGIFAGLTALTTLRLGRNAVDPFPIPVGLEKVAEGQFKAVAPTGATFDYVVSITATNGSIIGGATRVTIPQGHVESEILTVRRTPGITSEVSVAIQTLPRLPSVHYGYALVRADALPLSVIPRVNTAPVFIDGSSVTRAVAENTAAGTNIGAAIRARDAEDDTLTYTLNGADVRVADAAAFDIDAETGQLKTKAALDFETQKTYSLTITVSDGTLTDTITVRINVTDVHEPPPPPPSINNAPVFTDGTSTTRSVDENTASGTNIGNPVAATDPDSEDTLTYRLGGTDAASFGIVNTSGQLQTRAALDFETKSSYSVTVSVSDGKGGTDSITVTISVTDVNEPPPPPTNNVPVFTDGISTTRSIAENTASGQNIGNPVAATDADNDTLTYALGGTDADSFSIVSTSGQLQTSAALDFETKNAYSVTVSVSDGKGGTDSIDITISVTDVNEDPPPPTNNAPVFTDGISTTRSVAENTASGTNIGNPVAATDTDNDVLTYTLGGTDEASFGIVSTSGQLQTRAALDYETKKSYSVTVSVSDGKGGTDSIDVTINVTDVNEDPPPPPQPTNNAPVFTDGTNTTRSVAENTAAGQNIGTAIAATDTDNDTLTYTLGGTDADAFGIVSTSGQLQTRAALDYETKKSYSVTVSVSDGKGGSDSIDVTINVTDVNETPPPPPQPTNNAPVFTDGTSTTRSVAENTASGQNIGNPVAATDADNDTLTYTLSGDDAASFGIVSTSGQLQTRAALDYETKKSYSVTVSVSDGNGGSDSIDVTINVTDVNEPPPQPPPPTNNAPVFTDGTNTTRSVAENTAAGQNIGTAVAATDADNDTLTYTLGGTDADAFGIVSTSGQLQTSAALDYETKKSYSVTVSVSDGKGGSDSVAVTINVTDVDEDPPQPTNNAPVFTDGDSTTRSVAENTAAGQNIGTAIAATDTDNDTLTYTLGGTDADAFGIVSTSGQLQTKAALDHETDDSYSVTVSVSDGNGGSDAIDVTISVTNVNDNAPVFTDGETTTRSIAENTAASTNIGTAVAATDADNDTLTYTLGGTDASSFSIISASGQLQTKAALDYETKKSYSVAITASDGTFTDTITVTINVRNVNEAPSFPAENTTRSVAENTAAGQNIGNPVAATDADGDTLTYRLSGTDAASFGIVSTSGQLQTKAALDYETKKSYSVTVSVSDGKGGTDSITVTINVTDVNETPPPPPPQPTNNAPVFTDGTTTTRSVAENTAAGQNIGSAVAATDADNDTLTYTLGGTDAASFGIVSTSGQLQTKAALDHETDDSYSVTVSVSDGKRGSDSITVTISVTDVNEAPTFASGTTISNITATKDTAITSVTLPAASDVDANTTLTYTLTPALPTGLTFNQATRVLDGTPTAATAQTTYTYTASDGTNSAALTFTITVQAPAANNAPTFGTATISNISATAGTAITSVTLPVATDADGDAITYTLTPALPAGLTFTPSTRILAGTPTAATAVATYTYTASDGTDSAALTFTITVQAPAANNAPSFGTATISNISATAGTAITSVTLPVATDADGDAITYTLTPALPAGLTFTPSTRILAGTPTAATAVATYTYTASDGTDSASLTFTITVVAPTNNAPVFTDGTSTTRSIAENTAANTNIGTAVAATDADNDVLTYTLGGTDAGSFGIVSTSGQLQTKAALDFETDNAYEVTVTASDGNGGSTDITVTINVTDANDAPVFTDGATTTRTIAENTAANTNIGTAVAATDQDRIPDPDNEGQFLPKDTLTYTLSGDDATAFDIVSTSGQLQTSAALDFETKKSYSVTVSVSDGKGGNDSIDVTIDLTDVDETPENNAPVFTDGDNTTRTVAENTAAEQNIGTAVEATDADNDTLTYTLSGDDAAAFSIVSTSGQLQTSAALDYETKKSYSVTVSVADGKGGNDSIDVTIDLTDVDETPENNAPVFTDGDNTTRTVVENTAAEQNIGTAVEATDQDNDTLTYTLSGTDADAFSILSTSGQLQTKNALDFETKNAYTVTVAVADGNGGSGSITVTINLTDVNEAPHFSKTQVTLSVAEDAAIGTPIGDPFQATDPDGDTLTYSLRRADADAFSIDASTGQLKTNTPLDYEAKQTYDALAVRATDADGTFDAIVVTINVTDVDENTAPTFTDGDSTTRTVAENTAAEQNIGTVVEATDQDGDTLTYTLGGTDADAFSILSTSGQLQTSAALDYETKKSYSVTVSVADGNGGNDSIDVTISVTDANDAPIFTDGDSTTRTVAENTAAEQNIGTAIAATDADNDTLTYTLGGTDAAAFSIVSTSGQLQTKNTLDFETKNTYTVTVAVADGNGGSGSITVTINVTDVNEAPRFSKTQVTLSVAEDATVGTPIGDPFQATDPDGDTLTYSLRRADAAAFSIDASTGQLKTNILLDYEAKQTYNALAVRATDADGKFDAIVVTINVTDVDENTAPTFTDGDSTTRSVAENTAAEQNIGTAVAATDQDNDTLTYTLSGTDADAFNIVSTSGQLKTKAALDFEAKNAYTLTITASDGNLTDSIPVTINVTDVTEIDPPLRERTLQVRDAIVAEVPGVNNPDDVTDTHLAAITSLNLNNKGITSLKFGDFNGLTSLRDLRLDNNAISDISHLEDLEDLTSLKTLNLESNFISDISPLEGLTSLTDLRLRGNPISDYAPLRRLQTAKPSLDIDINLNNNLPVFSEGDPATRAIAANTAAGINIGAAISATDADSDTLTYSLGGIDAESFGIVSTSGQLQTKAALDFETKSSYTVTVNVYDGNSGGDRITVTINVTEANNAPVFTEGTSATRAVAENTTSGQNIGTVVAATDADNDTLTYTLGGTDADAFSIVSTSGQLQTKNTLDFETKNAYTLTVEVADGNGGSGSITVTINLTDVNEAPRFSKTQVTLSVAEDAAIGTPIGDPFQATDPDGDTLTYSLRRADADAFSIDASTGQLKTNILLDYEAKQTYNALAVRATDADGKFDAIVVTINVTDVDENTAPVFTDGDSTTRTVAENTASGQNIGTAVAATDADNDVLTYTLGGTDADAFDIVSTSGQLQTKNALDFETKNAYTVTVAVSDANGDSDSITVTINLTDVNEAPRFSKTRITLSVAEDAAVGTAIGDPFQATDPDGDTLTYSLRRADADAFSIDASTGQLETNTPLDYEVKKVYDNLAVRATDADGKFDAIVVTVNITDVVEVPVAQFVPFKNALLPNFPNPFNPETWIPYQLSKPAEVTLTIYNMRGVVVRQLKLGHQAAGFYHNRSRAIHWDGRNMFGEKVATGVYFYTLKAGDYTATRKLLIRK